MAYGQKSFIGIYTDVRRMFWGLLRKKSFVEIFFKMLPTARNNL